MDGKRNENAAVDVANEHERSEPFLSRAVEVHDPLMARRCQRERRIRSIVKAPFGNGGETFSPAEKVQRWHSRGTSLPFLRFSPCPVFVHSSLSLSLSQTVLCIFLSSIFGSNASFQPLRASFISLSTVLIAPPNRQLRSLLCIPSFFPSYSFSLPLSLTHSLTLSLSLSPSHA